MRTHRLTAFGHRLWSHGRTILNPSKSGNSIRLSMPVLKGTSSNRRTTLLVAPAVTVGGFLACVLLYAIPGALLFFAFLFPVIILALIVGLLFIAIVIGRVYWPSALALIPACALVFLLVAYPRPPVGVAATVATWFQFAVLRPKLTRMAEVHNLGTASSLIVLTVDGFVPVGSNGFVYDSTGQVGQVSAERSRKWQSIAARTVLGDGCDWTVRHLYGPYYSYFSSC
jgi:hypothetical protein